MPINRLLKSLACAAKRPSILNKAKITQRDDGRAVFLALA